MRLQLSLEASNLKNVAGLFKGTSDPYAIVTDFHTGEEIGRTETIIDCLDPKWTKMIHIPDFTPHEDQTQIEISLYDDLFGKGTDKKMKLLTDTDSIMISGNEEMSSIIIPVQDLYQTCIEEKRLYKYSMERYGGRGVLTLCVEESEETDESIILQFRALKVKNVEPGLLGLNKSDPFLQIYKKRDHQLNNDDDDDDDDASKWQIVYRTEHIDNNLRPVWDPFTISMEDFCNGDLEKELKIEMWDAQPQGKHRIIGQIRISNKLKNSLHSEGDDSDEILTPLTTSMILDRVTRGGNADETNAFRFWKIRENGQVKPKSVGSLIVLQARIT